MSVGFAHSSVLPRFITYKFSIAARPLTFTERTQCCKIIMRTPPVEILPAVLDSTNTAAHNPSEPQKYCQVPREGLSSKVSDLKQKSCDPEQPMPERIPVCKRFYGDGGARMIGHHPGRMNFQFCRLINTDLVGGPPRPRSRKLPIYHKGCSLSS
ncbi:hypothetical protein KM043_018771 [Ampulex compressa]|nr:hypothetical protein KM043_018771 [Ampulex compressa]